MEDELLIAEVLSDILRAEGFKFIKTASSYSEALQMLANYTFDLAFLDVFVGEGKTGIDLGQLIREKFQMSLVFTTSYSDAKTLQAIANLKPEMYISKPYRLSDIRAAMQIIHSKRTEERAIIVKSSGELVTILVSSIQYVKTDNVYLTIYCDEKSVLVRTTLESFLYEHRSIGLIRVHRSFAVAINRIQTYIDGAILLDEVEVPVSRSYRKALQAFLNDFIFD